MMFKNQKARAKRGSNTRPKDLQSLARTTELLTRLLGKVAKLVLYKRGRIFLLIVYCARIVYVPSLHGAFGCICWACISYRRLYGLY